MTGHNIEGINLSGHPSMLSWISRTHANREPITVSLI